MRHVQFTIITGLSGSGKSFVHNVLEDNGYFCVDNLPLSLVSKFFDLTRASDHGEIEKVAMVLDIRDPTFAKDFGHKYQELASQYTVRLLFLEASDEVLARRFSETRRPHPLALDAPLQEALQLERRMLAPVRELADAVVDTSRFSVHELRDYVCERFVGASKSDGGLVVSVFSFGFKYGIPLDSDLLFDVRFLANPYFVPKLKSKTGLDDDVVAYIHDAEGTREFEERLISFVHYLIPRYVKEGKSYLTISVGCTGGKHRSVTVANDLAESLKKAQNQVAVVHRDLDKR